MNQKKIGFFRALVLYHAQLAIAYFLVLRRLGDVHLMIYREIRYHLFFLLSGGFVFFYGAKKIIYYELIYRPGRRLLAREAQLKQDGIDFDHIRQGDDS